ncbi:hypothetical protein CI610_03211 [invertebrate metagenome]|uniref:Uncharacterized protein n=1 Tax=invertebrate metagenome TaxID=1711999 RepID=A0A2H9T3P5_9ZZZZ
MKYWMKLRNSRNYISQSCYDDMLENNDRWMLNIKEELYRIGFGYKWELQKVDINDLQMTKERSFDLYERVCRKKYIVL